MLDITTVGTGSNLTRTPPLHRVAIDMSTVPKIWRKLPLHLFVEDGKLFIKCRSAQKSIELSEMDPQYRDIREQEQTIAMLEEQIEQLESRVLRAEARYWDREPVRGRAR